MLSPTQDLLRLDDIRLFHKGACHIFAVELLNKWSDETYELRRLKVRCGSDPPFLAYHVYCFKDGYLVDVCGVRREDDYISLVRGRLSISKCIAPSQITVSPLPVSPAELLATCNTHEGIMENSFELLTDSNFVAEAQNRAQKLLEHFGDVYRVSVLKTGATISGK